MWELVCVKSRKDSRIVPQVQADANVERFDVVLHLEEIQTECLRLPVVAGEENGGPVWRGAKVARRQDVHRDSRLAAQNG